MRINRHRRGRWVRVAALAVTTAFVLSSCGGSKGGSSSGSGNSAKATEAKYGGKAIYAISAENSDGWCLPQAQLAPPGIQVARSIYDTLMIPNQDGDLVPFLAKSLTPNDDFTEWTLELREGIKFHDGTDMDAQVVKNNIDAYRGTYPARKPLLFLFVFSDIADVEVTGPLSLKLTTKTPWSSLPQVLWSTGRVGIMAQAQLDDPATCDSKLIGTGPFKLVEWSKNEKMVLERNENYWQKDAKGNQLPYLDGMEYRPVLNASVRINSLLSGEVNMMHGLSPQDYETVDDEVDKGTLTNNRSEAFATTSFLQLNNAELPFKNKNARMALITSIDMKTYNDTVNHGRAKVANGPFAPGSIGYLEDSGYPKYDPDAAKKYVAAYERETGEKLRLTILSTTDPEVISAMTVIQDMAKKVGIDAKVQPMEVAALVSTSVSGDYDAAGFANFPGGDPDDNKVWWYGTSPVNLSKFNDSEINRLLDEGRATPDREKRQEIYGNINRRFASEGYSAWLNWTVSNVVTSSSVHGVIGPTLPSGDKPSPALVNGHSMEWVWMD